MIIIRIVKCVDCGHRYSIRTDMPGKDRCPQCGSYRSDLVELQYEEE